MRLRAVEQLAADLAYRATHAQLGAVFDPPAAITIPESPIDALVVAHRSIPRVLSALGDLADAIHQAAIDRRAAADAASAELAAAEERHTETGITLQSLSSSRSAIPLRQQEALDAAHRTLARGYSHAEAVRNQRSELRVVRDNLLLEVQHSDSETALTSAAATHAGYLADEGRRRATEAGAQLDDLHSRIADLDSQVEDTRRTVVRLRREHDLAARTSIHVGDMLSALDDRPAAEWERRWTLASSAAMDEMLRLDGISDSLAAWLLANRDPDEDAPLDPAYQSTAMEAAVERAATTSYSPSGPQPLSETEYLRRNNLVVAAERAVEEAIRRQREFLASPRPRRFTARGRRQSDDESNRFAAAVTNAMAGVRRAQEERGRAQIDQKQVAIRSWAHAVTEQWRTLGAQAETTATQLTEQLALAQAREAELRSGREIVEVQLSQGIELTNRENANTQLLEHNLADATAAASEASQLAIRVRGQATKAEQAVRDIDAMLTEADNAWRADQKQLATLDEAVEQDRISWLHVQDQRRASLEDEQAHLVELIDIAREAEQRALTTAGRAAEISAAAAAVTERAAALTKQQQLIVPFDLSSTRVETD